MIESFSELISPSDSTPKTESEDGAFAGETYELEAVIVRRLDRYFEQLDGRAPHPLHDLVIRAVERPLLLYAMNRCAGNQCAAAQLLGINRNTLRKKLLEHGLLEARNSSSTRK